MNVVGKIDAKHQRQKCADLRALFVSSDPQKYKMWLIDERERVFLLLLDYAAQAARGHATLSGCRFCRCHR
jgi:hypothetical protein